MSETMFITIDSKMPYYHIYISFRDKKNKEVDVFFYNFQKRAVINSIVSPYIKNRAIVISGNVINRSDMNNVEIFESQKPFHQLILSDGRSPVDVKSTHAYLCFCLHKVKEPVRLCTQDFITPPLPQEKEEVKSLIGLMKCASFMGLNDNWSLATCALQLQEVAMTLVAKRKKIKLDKANVEKVLNKKIEKLSFSNQYEAFSKLVLALFDVEMPILTIHLRKMRAKVLHDGYNPKPEEAESIANFTIGLLRRLKDIR